MFLKYSHTSEYHFIPCVSSVWNCLGIFIGINLVQLITDLCRHCHFGCPSICLLTVCPSICMSIHPFIHPFVKYIISSSHKILSALLWDVISNMKNGHGLNGQNVSRNYPQYIPRNKIFMLYLCGTSQFTDIPHTIAPVPVNKPWGMLVNESLKSMRSDTGLNLGLRPANERHRYKVTLSLIGWAHT